MNTMIYKGIPVKFEDKEFKSIKELCRYYNILPTTFYHRLNRGWTVKECVYGKGEIKPMTEGSRKIVDKYIPPEFNTNLLWEENEFIYLDKIDLSSEIAKVVEKRMSLSYLIGRIEGKYDFDFCDDTILNFNSYLYSRYHSWYDIDTHKWICNLGETITINSYSTKNTINELKEINKV